MTQRLRFAHALADDREATVTRVAGDHEDGDDPRRRYDVRLPDDVAATTPDDGARLDSAGGSLTVTVPDGVGLARVRLATADGSTALRLPDPTLGAALTGALRGDERAARDLLDALPSAVAAVHLLAAHLDAEGVVSLVDALADADAAASDDLHARRYALCRAAALGENGLAVGTPSAFEALAAGLDGVSEIGDVTALDALGDLAAVRGIEPVTALGYDLPRLAHRDDGRFRAYWLAAVVRDRGLDAARDVAAAGDAGGRYERLKERAASADYWERGAAWRALVGPAARRSREEFAYVLANACYWTGEVTRTDARADELCYDGALAACEAGGGPAWVVEHARYERARAVGHRHRSATNHALAVAAFERARDIGEASDADDLAPWDPLYSRAVVASNARSAVGDHDGAVEILEAARGELDAYEIPDERREEMIHHLDGQRHERLALLARGETDGPVETHLDAAREHYAAVGFERSRERVAAKLDDARREGERDAGDGASNGAGGASTENGGRPSRGAGPAPRPPTENRGPSLADIPDLHDFLTESDPNAVGSADPGVVEDRPRDPRRDGY